MPSPAVGHTRALAKEWQQTVRIETKSFLLARINQSLQDEAAAILDGKNITYVRKTKTVRLLVDKEMIEKTRTFKSLAA